MDHVMCDEINTPEKTVHLKNTGTHTYYFEKKMYKNCIKEIHKKKNACSFTVPKNTIKTFVTKS